MHKLSYIFGIYLEVDLRSDTADIE